MYLPTSLYSIDGSSIGCLVVFKAVILQIQVACKQCSS